MVKHIKNHLFRVKSKTHYYRYLVKNPKWFLMFIFSRFKVVRFIVRSFSKRPLIKKYEKNYSAFKELNADSVVESLRRDGFSLNINLPKSVLQEILYFTSCTVCCGNKKQQLSFSYTEKEQAEAKYGRTFIQGDYFNASLLCPAIERLESDPMLLEIAAKYLNAEPVHIETRLWWSFAAESSPSEQMNAAQIFHYDLDDYCSLKFFFYLTDVDLSSGPHVCVRGSHKKKKLTHRFALLIGRSDKTIIDYYGIENVVTICGEAGLGFAEDTFCFHKGTPPTCSDRLMLSIEFALNDYGVRRRNSQQSSKSLIDQKL